MMELISLASGSGGNCTLIRSAQSCVAIDCGISYKRLTMGLTELGMGVDDLNAVFVTHEHMDHIKGLEMLLKKSEVPIYVPQGLASFLTYKYNGLGESLHEIRRGECLDFDDMSVCAFATLHDSVESVGYRVNGEHTLAVCTDLGRVTDEVAYAMQGVDCALVESNHDVDMLTKGPYPYSLKRRIMGDLGHLSNEACGDLCAYLSASGAKAFMLGHLSGENNSARHALEAVSAKLGKWRESVTLSVASEREITRLVMQ